MNREQLEQLFAGLAEKTILVLGDFFLDKYLIIDPERDEPSLETGLTAYQVVDVQKSPGAAGTVANNLAALQVGNIIALGVVGDDGEGYELQQELQRRGIVTEHLVVTDSRRTPTYTKPMRQEGDTARELNRLDIKNFTRTPAVVEADIAKKLQMLAPSVDAIVVMDQVVEENCGVVTDSIRNLLRQVATELPQLPIIADSRARIGQFTDVILKPNARETLAAVGCEPHESPSVAQASTAAKKLSQRTGRSVFTTLGANGQIVTTDNASHRVPTSELSGPIDIVGAGDSTTAGIICGLASGWEPTQAAVLGNIVASITVQQLGTTGTASPAQVLKRVQAFADIEPQPLEAM